MGLIDNIKQKLGIHYMKKEQAAVHRNKAALGLEEAHSVGVLFCADDIQDFKLVKKYVAYLKEWNKKVRVLGYYTEQNEPDVTYSRLEYFIFGKKELNWHYKPIDNAVEEFVNEEFDILIDMNLGEYLPLRYLAAVSRAKFKVGQYSENNKDVCDMMIELERDKSLKYYLRQVDTYLLMLNKKEGKAVEEQAK